MTGHAAPQGGPEAEATTAPVVAIVGRPNVGKSALFNRMVRGRIALVEDIPGTTRDRLYGDVEWRGRLFRLVDTGGLDLEARGSLSTQVQRQVQAAVDEAQAILFVVDSSQGVTASDLEVADVLRRTAKPILMLANKAESRARQEGAVEFYELGLGEPIAISAQHGAGVADVLDLLVDILPPAAVGLEAEALRIAIVGRPNVGKSMLLNAILGEERVIVSDVPGTTRDSIDTPFEYQGQRLMLVDTAGIRRKGHIGRGLEKHSVLRARRAVERADVALLVLEAPLGVTAQDAHIAGYVAEAFCGLVLVANKWDLVGGDGSNRREFERVARHWLRFVGWAPLCFVSAKERTGLPAVLEQGLRVGQERRRRIPTAELNALAQRATTEKPPPISAGGRLKLFYVTQAEAAPPTFVFFVNDASRVHFSYRRYLEKVLRKAYGFQGSPLRLVFRSRGER
jgi:GTP-binding protein